MKEAGSRIKGALASALAGWCPVVGGLRLVRAPDLSRATGHLDVVGKRMLIGPSHGLRTVRQNQGHGSV